MTVVTPGASVFVKAFRVSALTEEGTIAPGATTVTTKDGMKLNISPSMHTGADIAIENAAADLATLAKHGDMIKFYTVSLELAKPDPQIEQMCCGGTLLGSSAAALGEPGAPAVASQATEGTLAEAFYGYRVSQYNVFGESKAVTEVLSAKTSGATSAVVITPTGAAAGAQGYRIYGRAPGASQFIGTVPQTGTAALKKAIAIKGIKKGTPLVIEIEKVTVGIPGGTTFTTAAFASGKAVLKVIGYIPVGASSATVEIINEAENAAEVATGALKAVFWDTGSIVPSGNVQETDTTGGRGENLGVSASALGPVGNPNGVSIEAWSYNYVEGAPTAELPYWWWVLPRVRHMHIAARDLNNNNTATVMEGIGIGNEKWGSGPFGEWPSGTFPANKAWQRLRCGAEVVPTPSYEPQLATV